MSNNVKKTYTEEDVLAARLQGRKEAEEFLQLRINQTGQTYQEMFARKIKSVSSLFCSKANKVAYNRGMKDAEEFLWPCIIEYLTHLLRTNHELYKQLTSLDKTDPIDGVLIPYDLAGQIIKKLKINNKRDSHAKKLRYYMDILDRKMLESREKALGEIDEESKSI